jgi:hypothetical protein
VNAEIMALRHEVMWCSGARRPARARLGGPGDAGGIRACLVNLCARWRQVNDEMSLSLRQFEAAVREELGVGSVGRSWILAHERPPGLEPGHGWNWSPPPASPPSGSAWTLSPAAAGRHGDGRPGDGQLRRAPAARRRGLAARQGRPDGFPLRESTPCPGPLAPGVEGLGDVIAALQVVGALSPLSPAGARSTRDAPSMHFS